jgi:hypothetical protein
MTTISDRGIVDEIIAANGGEGITHIIEYQNQFNRQPAWKLCKGEDQYTYFMGASAFINPKLIWVVQSRWEEA